MSRIAITAAEAACALGDTLDSSLATWTAGRSGLTHCDGLLAGRIADRSLLKGRRYGAASNLAVQVARKAVAKAGWSEEELRKCWLFAASSRGNAGELLGSHAWRRPSRRFSASNTLHSEIAAAVSIELGIHGPWQMISNGCSAGLDALGLGWMAMKAGMTQRVLVVAVDLPLYPELLRDFEDTRLLSKNGMNDPLSPATSGFHPGEAGVAITLEAGGAGPAMLQYGANSDAYDSLVIPEDGAGLAELLAGFDKPNLVCPHATGTPNHAVAEMNALHRAYESVPPLLLLKPFTGHTLGASGLLDVALMAEALRRGGLPGNLAGLTCPEGLSLNVPASPQRVLKIASGMGGHNAAVMLGGE
ncbi:3-oxoacyl-(acyl-carrier-protein) synthase [Prosthecobacter fusiformis]|uniref:3-oxoacyl-(Acyl-carrier-protein) synthase n=1 Tax=Prosthecobacter fusiformis TaxID=48464 RepID=A0A4R7SQ40_9BACT|nr:beta-ketoacyl synthase N-terminal-like domain-containing protein [Prosthecobacter fusiformis]TDU81342.1 3-oxoacyl-(acyl-carrier-protein) synthase [Prosthecobacter fusiformis]